MKRLLTIIVVILFGSATLLAQTGTTPTDSLTSQEIVEMLYASGAIDQTDSTDKYLPISREQAEELITKMIIAVRAPHVEARMKDQMVQDFKLDMLRRKLLDRALKELYIDEYRERMDRMERLLMMLLVSQSGGNIDPTTVHNIILSGSAQDREIVQPLITNILPTSTATDETPLSEAPILVESGKMPTTVIVPVAGATAEPTAQTTTPVVPAQIVMTPGYFKHQVFFANASSQLSDDARKTLDTVVILMQKNSRTRVQLRGYASREGRVEFNNKLSARRVNAVAEYLYDKGIDLSRLEIIPTGIDSMKDNYADARRVDITPAPEK